jgi:hypothetical protein
MKKVNSTFISSLALMLLSLAVLLYNWNSTQKWRYDYSLIGFIIFFVVCLVSTYMTFFYRKSKIET